MKRLLLLAACCGLCPSAFAQPLDEDALLAPYQGAQGPVRSIDPARFPQMEVRVGEKESRTLAQIVPLLTANQRKLEDQLKQAPAGALFARPQFSQEVFEFPDAFALVRRTHLEVANPQELARISEDYAQFLGQPQTGAVKLDDPAQAEFERYRANDIPKLAAGHPLRLAAEQGPQALLQAIVRGQGDFEITDTYLLPRKNLFQNGLQPIPKQLFMPAIGSDPLNRLALPNRPEIVIPPGPDPLDKRTGRNFAHVNFLTGFSRGSSWQWQRRWDYPSGFFRMSLGMSYGVGMRVPLRIDAETSPTQIEIRDRQDRPVNLVTTVSAHPFDAPVDFYRRMGLPDRLLFDGQEAVLESRFYYGYKLRALWTDVLHQRRQDLGFAYGQNLEAPFADSNSSLRLAIPPELTHTAIHAGPLNGFAQAALRLDGKGSIEISHEPLWNGQNGPSQRLSFRQVSPQTVITQLPALVARAGQQVQARYGFRFFNPAYRIDLDLTPEVRVGLDANFKVWSRSFRTDWLALNGFRVNLGEVELTRHAGTANEFRYQDGLKSFLALLVGSSTPTLSLPAQGSQLAIRSLSNGNYLRAGLGRDCHLGAVSRQRAGWETFQVERLGGDRIALRSLQNGRWVRAGVGRDNLLAAVSQRVDAWETFHLISLGQNQYAMRSASNQLYVGVASDGTLHASSPTLEDAQKFTLETTR